MISTELGQLEFNGNLNSGEASEGQVSVLVSTVMFAGTDMVQRGAKKNVLTSS
jgi:hypothetical protein